MLDLQEDSATTTRRLGGELMDEQVKREIGDAAIVGILVSLAATVI